MGITMAKKFSEINPDKLDENVFNLIGEQWMLITAGTSDHFNTMTASWGTMGILWHLPVAICVIRPQRYTFEFAESSDYYTLSFLEPGNRKILQFCGTHSGRDNDKVMETGLEPRITRLGNIYFEQCKLVLECKKLYADSLKEDAFIIPELTRKNYPKGDFHKFYIGEIVSCLVAE
jgi:flavin reductase (DIM6/NTAB) family NADH-FMN oxidoreductase RutF